MKDKALVDQPDLQTTENRAQALADILAFPLRRLTERDSRAYEIGAVSTNAQDSRQDDSATPDRAPPYVSATSLPDFLVVLLVFLFVP